MQWYLARWSFFALLGIISLVKGIGFGAVLTLAITVSMLLWERDVAALRRLWFYRGWMLTIVLTFGWPLCMVVQHGELALALWLVDSEAFD